MKKKFGPFIINNHKPVIIAEVGVNHGGNFALAKKYISMCKKSGADAIKFQTYKAETIASENSPAYWDLQLEKTKSQFELFKKYDRLGYSEFKKLKNICDKKKILFMTTLFDFNDVSKYDSLIKIYKISSSDITNVPLLRKIGQQKKYTIISTGASTIKEIKYALKVLALPKNKVCIMHCVLNYPTKDAFANLGYIKTLKRIFKGYVIGYSDHTVADKSLTSITLASDLGAQIIEKHFTLNKNLKGNDHYHSMDGKDLINFKRIMHKRNTLRGNGIKNLSNEKNSILFARRGIYARKDIYRGEILTDKNLITLRPENSLSSKYWDFAVGKKIKKNIKKGESISRSVL
jgi:N-acetylneuraminate synthase